MRLVMDLLADPVLDTLVSGESDFEELPAVMSRLAAAPSASVCHRIRYGSPSEGG
jgi:hypothetical protein